MTATHINQITDAMIQARLARIQGASVSWQRVPRDAEQIDQLVDDRACRLTVANVREMLGHDLNGESPDDEVRMAISIAAEPDPEDLRYERLWDDYGGCVEVWYRPE